MYSFVMDFNVKPEGPAAERYLVTMMREWPGLYRRVEGVIGTMFLANVFGLAGRYSFRMVLDLRSLDALSAVDNAYKTDAQWRRLLGEWFENRRDVQSRLLKQHSGDEEFLQRINKAAELSFIYVYAAPAKVRLEGLVNSYQSLLPSRTYTAVVQPEGEYGFEAWNSIRDIKSSDALGIAASTFGAINSQLFAVMREVDGALVAAA